MTNSDNPKSAKTQYQKQKKGTPSELAKRIKIKDLVYDNRNANLGTAIGADMLKKSIKRFGAGRGVLVDKNLKLIAGNHTVKELTKQGITDVIVVPVDGRTLVVTQRTDIEKDSKEGYELAIADNRVSQENISFDLEAIRELEAEFTLDLTDFAIDIGAPAPEDDDEPDSADQMEYPKLPSNAKYSDEGKDNQGKYEQSFFPLAIALTKSERLKFDEWKKELKLRTDTEAFQCLFKIATTK